MFIKKLKISKKTGVIRDLEFHNGMNLIIDDTPTDNKKLTGNNVGKTTVLKLVHFCLSGEGKEIYTDEEHKRDVYKEVKDFLIKNEVLITLILVENLEDTDSKQILIERNFLPGKEAVRKINGKQIAKKDFEDELSLLIFPEHKSKKPTFKQIISHNIRYKDDSINKTLKTLNRYTTDVEYETLYLFLLGCTFDNGDKRQALITKISQENAYKQRLEKNQTKNSYERALSIIEDEIDELNRKKLSLNLNENFEADLEKLNEIKYKISKCSSNITKLEIRREIILEAKTELERNISSIDLDQLQILYHESKENITDLHRTFEELVAYHNKMIVEKVRFITKELPELEDQIYREKKLINDLLSREKELTLKISKSDSFADLDNIVANINEKYRLKGEYENIITLIKEVDNTLNSLTQELNIIDATLYSDSFEEKLKIQITKFNKYFSAISNELYGEKYALNYEKVINKQTNVPVYKFNSFNLNMSSGKKQGEILCFDLAYTLFADSENIPCLHFLLNDKKELMHDNQLLKVADFVNEHEIQLVVSILKDKLPADLIEKSNIVIELSQSDKLFRVKS